MIIYPGLVGFVDVISHRPLNLCLVWRPPDVQQDACEWGMIHPGNTLWSAIW